MRFILAICLILGGGAAALLIAWGLFCIKAKDYDERQKIVSLSGYRLALFTLVCFQTIFGILSHLVDIPVERPLGQIFGAVLATGVFMVYRVANDAFFTRQQRPWVWCWLFAAMALLATAASMYICRTTGFVDEGKLNMACLIPILGAFHLAQWIATVLKLCSDRRKERSV